MKHILLTATLFSSLGALAWNVSTEQTMQSALIEEFTGIHCPNCPDGHKVATALMNLHPEDVYTVAIHAGGYATPSVGEPNYITEVGKSIHDYFGANSYPSGVVSRQNSGDGMIIGRYSWGPACRVVTGTPSPVNLWSAVNYNAETRQLTVEVEGYYTDDMLQPKLNVFLLQNEILGPQSGGMLGFEYPHRHMLRARLTDNDLGDFISESAKGEYFSRTITYTIPEDIEGVPTDPANMEVLTFVTDGTENVRKVCEARIPVEEAAKVLNVSSSLPPIAIGKNYGFDFVEVYLNNHGSQELTSAEFDITLNGVLQTAEWTGTVPAHTNQLVRVPLGGAWKSAMDNESNTYIIRMMKVNGQDVETSSLRGSFNEIAAYPDELTLKIKTDMDAADNTYRIYDENGTIVHEFGPYENGVAEEYTESVSLENGKVYCLEVFDCWGDGVRHPLGYVKLLDKYGKQVAQYKEINDYGMRQFFRTDATLGVDAPVAQDVVEVEYIDLTGRKVMQPTPGVYLVRTTYADGSVITAKQMVRAQ